MKKKWIGTLLSVSMAFSMFAPMAFAASDRQVGSQIGSMMGTVKDSDVREAESAQVASDLKFIFEEASVKKDGKYVLNEGKIAQKFGFDNVATISAFVKLANGEQLTANMLEGVPNPDAGEFSTASWGSCVANQIIDFTGIGFLTGGMMEMIEKKLWDKLAVEIIKIVGKNAIKGGAVGLAASLVWFSIRCIGQ
ncbi:hypothetical protein ABN764_04485 [Paenibacillaceae sp. P-4]|uniref:Uncharacterized protein n=1 Tax=Paenibacillus suaedae TaxID=3077233 RepID=A0AAJ2N5N3_9BACL|nr:MULTISPECIES: hypothetical protein [unclassified Paenibacillus]MDT8977805.1 hypothetical protein [Paenibacillus sp. chi10]GAV12901.1 hypothetical protein PBN151_2834 [Paenibacillus sp. NAIST15-1]